MNYILLYQAAVCVTTQSTKRSAAVPEHTHVQRIAGVKALPLAWMRDVERNGVNSTCGHD